MTSAVISATSARVAWACPIPPTTPARDADTRALLGQYNGYVQKILVLTGTPADKAAAEAQQVIDLETRIAQSSKSLIDLRNPRANYARVPVADLAKSYRKLQLTKFLEAQGVNDDAVSIANPQLFAQLDQLVGSLKPAQWKAYLRWRVGDAMAPYMAKPWRDASFDFRGRLLAGQTAPAARQQVVLDAISQAAGPMLGHEYVARYLSPGTKTRAEEIAANVHKAIEAAVDGDAHLSASAKAEAKAKLAALKIEIGAPRRDLDYTVQPMGRGSFGSNMLIASTWHHREEMKRIGRGNADRRWDVLPQQPALAYDMAQNRLIVTAAVLQAPVFDVTADIAAQYGSFGALVGRELSHAIDNKGRLVDAKGEVRDWWTATDASAWDARGNRIAAQYGTYLDPVLGTPLDGQRLRDVAIADQAGVELARAAYNAAYAGASKNAKQAFYSGWATPMAGAADPRSGDRTRRQQRVCAWAMARQRPSGQSIRLRRSLRLQGHARRCSSCPSNALRCGHLQRSNATRCCAGLARHAIAPPDPVKRNGAEARTASCFQRTTRIRGPRRLLRPNGGFPLQ